VLRGLRLNLPAAKQPLVRLQYQDFASPRDLRISPLLIRCEKMVTSSLSRLSGKNIVVQHLPRTEAGIDFAPDPKT
jgi:hypothetical protein